MFLREVQWNLVDTDTKGTCHGVRIIPVSKLSGLSENIVTDMHVIYLRLKKAKKERVGTMTAEKS